jgi:hypothetical protein
LQTIAYLVLISIDTLLTFKYNEGNIWGLPRLVGILPGQIH